MKKWLSILLALTLLLCAAVGAAYASEDCTLQLSKDEVIVERGKTTILKATIAGITEAKRAGITLTTSDQSVATVTAKGVVTGVSVGECTLTATSKYDATQTISIPVRVIVPVQKLTVTGANDSATVHIGETLQLNVAYLPADATEQSVVFTSSKDAVATVSETGVVSGIEAGKADIVVRSTDGHASAKFRVTVTQAPEGVDMAEESVSAAIGKKITLKATVYPKDAADKSLLWTSADEQIATVNSKGVVTITGVGETTVTITCKDNPAVKATVAVKGIELAKSVSFDSKTYQVIIGETAQLYVNVQPDDTTDKNVTYKVKNSKICSVDENGVVTGLKGGKTTVYAYAADGSKKRGSTTVEVIVPVTGVSYKTKDVRVGAGYHASFTATIAPADATIKDMTWTSSDESVATVSGTTNRFKIVGRKWGRCQVTGTTLDGGYTVTINVDIGSLRHAIKVVKVSIKNGKPYLVLENRSNMDINQIQFQMQGYDSALQAIAMSTRGDHYVLYGTYDYTLAPGERTTHGQFTFSHHSNYLDLQVLQFAVTGWSTSTGYYDHNGVLQYDYDIPQKNWEWITYPSDTNTDLLKQ